jgi:hypothetical protein
MQVRADLIDLITRLKIYELGARPGLCSVNLANI